MIKKVKVFSTKGNKIVVVETDATTWGQLQGDLRTNGIEVGGMKAIIGENQLTLESSSAILPEVTDALGNRTGNFTLFLNPIKMKSGTEDPATLGYFQIKRYIADLCASNIVARGFFGNYTHMGTAQLQSKMAEWLNGELNCVVTPGATPPCVQGDTRERKEEEIEEEEIEEEEEEIEEEGVEEEEIEEEGVEEKEEETPGERVHQLIEECIAAVTRIPDVCMRDVIELSNTTIAKLLLIKELLNSLTGVEVTEVKKEIEVLLSWWEGIKDNLGDVNNSLG